MKNIKKIMTITTASLFIAGFGLVANAKEDVQVKEPVQVETTSPTRQRMMKEDPSADCFQNEGRPLTEAQRENKRQAQREHAKVQKDKGKGQREQANFQKGMTKEKGPKDDSLCLDPKGREERQALAKERQATREERQAERQEVRADNQKNRKSGDCTNTPQNQNKSKGQELGKRHGRNK